MAKKDIMQFQRTRRYAAGVAAINAANNAGNVKAALVAHGKKLDFDMVAYGQLSADNQSIIDSAVLSGKGTGYASRDALALVFVPALLEQVGIEFALGLINAALSAERIAQLAEKYGDAWGLELDDYRRLSAANKEAVCEEILDGQPYTGVDVVLQTFESAVEDALEEQALEAINEATADDMAAVIAMYADVYDLDLEDYDKLDNDGKDNVHAALVGKDFQTLAAVKSAFETAVAGEQALEAINEATADDMAAVIAMYADVYDLDLEDYDKLDNDGKDNVHAALVGKDFQTLAAVKSAFETAVAGEGGG